MYVHNYLHLQHISLPGTFIDGSDDEYGKKSPPCFFWSSIFQRPDSRTSSKRGVTVDPNSINDTTHMQLPETDMAENLGRLKIELHIKLIPFDTLLNWLHFISKQIFSLLIHKL